MNLGFIIGSDSIDFGSASQSQASSFFSRVDRLAGYRRSSYYEYMLKKVTPPGAVDAWLKCVTLHAGGLSMSYAVRGSTIEMHVNYVRLHGMDPATIEGGFAGVGPEENLEISGITPSEFRQGKTVLFIRIKDPRKDSLISANTAVGVVSLYIPAEAEEPELPTIRVVDMSVVQVKKKRRKDEQINWANTFTLRFNREYTSAKVELIQVASGDVLKGSTVDRMKDSRSCCVGYVDLLIVGHPQESNYINRQTYKVTVEYPDASTIRTAVFRVKAPPVQLL